MTAKTAARLTIDVSPEFRDELKIQAIAHGKTLKDYVIDSLTDRLLQDSAEEGKAWGEMSEAAKEEGLLSEQESEGLLARMRDA